VSATPRSRSGPWPFVTRRMLVGADGVLREWHSRAWRKAHLGAALNRPIGALFAIGSLLFAAGSVFSLWPALAQSVSLDATAVNAVFFAGSVPFTLAAALQWFQVAHAAPFADVDASRRLFGWRPRDIGWLSCALQFAGTLLFNLNTFDAMHAPRGWLAQDLAIWAPDLVGSMLFLASGYLAFVETCHAHGAWRPRELAWWITAINLFGCVAFMVSALFAFVPQHAAVFPMATWAAANTLLGALGFLAGSLLLLREA
jgi:hypothetical protein